MARRPKAERGSRNHSFSEDGTSSNFSRRQPGYPLITRDKKAVNIDWTSNLEYRKYRGRIPAEGYDPNNPEVKASVPNYTVILNTPSTEIPQTSYSPTIDITSPTNGSSVSAGSTITITATATEYPHYVALFINGVFIEQKAVLPSRRGIQTQTFNFLYVVPLDLVGTELIVRTDVKGVSSGDGFVIWKPASTGTTDAANRLIWESLGTSRFYDQAVHGYDKATPPDFLLSQPEDSSTVTLTVI